ncbi:hypothetical protein R50076_02430 [Gilvimarinus japonicus]
MIHPKSSGPWGSQEPPAFVIVNSPITGLEKTNSPAGTRASHCIRMQRKLAMNTYVFGCRPLWARLSWTSMPYFAPHDPAK